jgi:hypothetical protein
VTQKIKTPKWIEKLPAWAKFNPKDEFVEVDPDVVYSKFLKLMEELDPVYANVSTEITQDGLEIARLLFTRTLKKIMYENGGEFLSLRILKKDQKWALKNFETRAQRKEKPLSKQQAYVKLGFNVALGKPIKI